MLTATKPLLALTAADLMSTNVVTVPQSMSLQGAARMLSRAEISGAPVVDSEGRCVGVLSATDFVSWAEKGEHAAKQGKEACSCAFFSAWQVLEMEDLPTSEVCRYMTKDPVTVPPGTPIGAVAQKMVDGHIHRVIVVDSDERPTGIVSSTDILAAVAYADRKRLAAKG